MFHFPFASAIKQLAHLNNIPSPAPSGYTCMPVWRPIGPINNDTNKTITRYKIYWLLL